MQRTLACCALWAVLSATGAPAHPEAQGESLSVRYDGERYENPLVPDHGLPAIWNHLWSRGGPWPDWVASQPGPPPPERIQGGHLRVTWVNHATVLIQMHGVNILTDPIWSRRAGRWGMGPKRVCDPGLRFEDLPPIDLVLISHNHYDHLDVPTLQRLAETHPCRFIVPSRNGGFLRKQGLGKLHELGWWEELDVAPGLRVKALPARHGSQRGLLDRDRALWCSFAVTGDSGSLFFAGDTGFGPHFAEIAQQLGPFRAALLPIGNYAPRAFMAPSHMDPEEALRAAELLGARTFVPMHYGTFRDGDESYEAPLRDLAKALTGRPGSGARIRILKGGEGADLP